MNHERWARLAVEIRSPLRRGAWYRVLRLERDSVVLEVRQQAYILPLPSLDLSEQRPNTWGVVQRDSGEYLVCPHCAERVWVGRPVTTLTCTRCGETYAVGGSYASQQTRARQAAD